MSSFAKETLPISLEDEMRRSCGYYAMSVIVGRALPDVRDGLKTDTVECCMQCTSKTTDWNRAYKKSATVLSVMSWVNTTLGDRAIYDTIVRNGARLLFALYLGGRTGQASARWTVMRRRQCVIPKCVWRKSAISC